MTTQTLTTRNSTFKIGWIALLIMSALAALSHFILTIVMLDLAINFLG